MDVIDKTLLSDDKKLLATNTFEHSIGAGDAVKRLFDAFEIHSEKLCVFDESTRLSYRDVASLASQIYQVLLDSGLEPGDRVLVDVSNRIELLPIVLACLCRGAVVTPMMPRFSAKDKRECFKCVVPKVLICESTTEYQMDDDLGLLIENIGVFALDESDYPADGNAPSLLKLALSKAPERPSPEADRVNPVVLIDFTSATTSKRKGVEITAAMMAHRANVYRKVGGWQDGWRLLVAMPFGKVLVASLFMVLTSGGSFAVLPRFTLEKFFNSLTNFKIDAVVLVPPMLRQISQALNLEQGPPGSLKTIFFGGASLDKPTLRRITDVWGDVCFQLFGQTEVANIAMAVPEDFDEEFYNEPDNTFVGRSIYPDKLAFLVGDIVADTCSMQSPGEILVHRSIATSGYVNDRSLYERSCVGDAWFRTGDMGYIDDNGALHFLGRLKESANLGGVIVYCEPITSLLNTHVAIKEAVVFAVPDEVLGEKVEAALALVDLKSTNCELLEIELGKLIESRLGRDSVPATYAYLPSLPQTAAGKVDMKALRNSR